MIAYLLNKIGAVRALQKRTSSLSPLAADSPPSPRTSPGTPAQYDYKGIPSDAFFFGCTPEEYEIYLLKAHPDGSGCGAGCAATTGPNVSQLGDSGASAGGDS